jgi:integrase/recombinase XerD
MQTGDVTLKEGKIFVAGTRRSNERTLKLESQQVFDLMDYINDTRKQILHHRNITTQELFLQLGEGKNKSNLLSMLVTHLKQMNSKVKSIDQLRASVIVHWLRLYNLRKVQIMAGHRYISSTENYKANNLDDLKEDIKNYHPF